MTNGFKGVVNRSFRAEGRFVMYNSPCWPPAAKNVLLLSLKDSRAVGVEGGSDKASEIEREWVGEKKKISTCLLPSESKDSLGNKASGCEVQSK